MVLRPIVRPGPPRLYDFSIRHQLNVGPRQGAAVGCKSAAHFPADTGFGAGELGVADHIHGVVKGSANLTHNFNRGLRTIQMNSNEGFASLNDAAKDSVLRAVEAQHPDFFEELVEQT